MVYELPQAGDPNWDVKLNQSIEAVKTTADGATSGLTGKLDASQKGAASGVAPLDAGQKLPEANVPDRLTASALTASYVTQGVAATGVAATDTANLQDALTAAATRRMRLPKGTYLINAALTIPSGADIDFGGATIRRAAGAGVFDMLTATSVSGITLRNLTIDGNKDANSLVASNAGDRFGGLVLNSVTDSLLANLTVTGTVNNELTAGIYLNGCSDIYASNINGYGNDRTAILLNACSRVTIDGSLTYSNLGSGISSSASPECAYLNIVSHDNGYSNLSVNGLRSRVSNVLTYNSAFSGLNIGHASSPTDDTTVTNVQSYGNTYEGITITNSARVLVSNFECHSNARNNIRVMAGASACRFVNGTARDSTGGQGIFLEVGEGHSVVNVGAFGNAVSGINIGATASGAQIGPGVRCYNNGKVTSANSAGVIVNTATNCRLVGVDAFDDQGTKTQESGVWLAGGTGNVLTGCRIENNKTNQLRTTSSPQYVNYQGDGATGAARITGSSFVLAAAQLGFFSVAPVSRPGSYTQTYATATRTHAAYTADTESVAYTGAADGEAKLADLNALRVAYENVRSSHENTKQVLNQVIDDLQSLGLLQ